MLKNLVTPLLIALFLGCSTYYYLADRATRPVQVGTMAQPPGSGTPMVPNHQIQPPPPLPPTNLPDVDAMVIIDNSGSMFGLKCGSQEHILANDPDQLRIQGADIVIGSLAADLDPRKTSLGIVAFGDTATLVSKLTQLSNQDSTSNVNSTDRSHLAALIKHPECAGETNIVGALQLAVQELRSSRHTVGNIPVIIFLTDGNPTQGGYFTEIDRQLDSLGDVQFFAVILGNGAQLNQSKQFWSSQSQRRSNVVYHPLASSADIPDLYNAITTRLNQVPDANVPALPPSQRVVVPMPTNVRQAVMKVIKAKPQVAVQIQDPAGADPRQLPPDRFRTLLNNSTVEVYIIGRPVAGDWVFSVPNGEVLTVLQPEYRSIYRVQLLQPDSLGLLAVDQPTNLVVQVVDMDSQQPLTGSFTITGSYRLQAQPESANQDVAFQSGPVAPQSNALVPTGTFTEGQEYILSFQVQDDVGLGSQPTVYQLPAGRLPVISSVVANPLAAYVDEPINLVAQVANADVVSGTAGLNLAPLPGVGGVTFQRKDAKTYSATVPPLNRPGTYALSIAYRGKTTSGRDFSSISNVAVTVRERDWMIWLRKLAYVLAGLTGAFLIFRFVLLSPLIPLFQKLGLSPQGYVAITPSGAGEPNEESVASILQRRRKLRRLTIGVGPSFDIPLEKPQASDSDSAVPSKQPGLKERLWGPKPLGYLRKQGSNTIMEVGNKPECMFGTTPKELTIGPDMISFSLKPILHPADDDESVR